MHNGHVSVQTVAPLVVLVRPFVILPKTLSLMSVHRRLRTTSSSYTSTLDVVKRPPPLPQLSPLADAVSTAFASALAFCLAPPPSVLQMLVCASKPCTQPASA